jgi:hypothetical protein
MHSYIFLAHLPQDLKPLNVMKVGDVWKLIDLDAAAKIDSPAGLKCSTGYAPPELLNDLGVVRSPANSASNALIAHQSFDAWSFGVLFYLLVTGKRLFNNDLEDNLSAADAQKLKAWSKRSLRRALKRIRTGGSRQLLLAKSLLENLLRPDSTERVQDFKEIINHPFFETNEENALVYVSHITADNSARLNELSRVARNASYIVSSTGPFDSAESHRPMSKADGAIIVFTEQYKSKVREEWGAQGEASPLMREALGICAMVRSNPTFFVYALTFSADVTTEQMRANLEDRAPRYGPVHKWAKFMKEVSNQAFDVELKVENTGEKSSMRQDSIHFSYSREDAELLFKSIEMVRRAEYKPTVALWGQGEYR